MYGNAIYIHNQQTNQPTLGSRGGWPARVSVPAGSTVKVVEAAIVGRYVGGWRGCVGMCYTKKPGARHMTYVSARLYAYSTAIHPKS